MNKLSTKHLCHPVFISGIHAADLNLSDMPMMVVSSTWPQRIMPASRVCDGDRIPIPMTEIGLEKMQRWAKRTLLDIPCAWPPPNREGAELRSIRLQCGFSQFEMAQAIEVKLVTLQSYEYGKTKSVPQEVMKRARAMRSDEHYTAVVKEYAGKSTKVIMEAWAYRTKARSVSDLARKLGVNKSTVSRWRTKNVAIPGWDLVRYEALVERVETTMKAQNMGRKPRNEETGK